jgi:hypothetical protein
MRIRQQSGRSGTRRIGADLDPPPCSPQMSCAADVITLSEPFDRDLRFQPVDKYCHTAVNSAGLDGSDVPLNANRHISGVQADVGGPMNNSHKMSQSPWDEHHDMFTGPLIHHQSGFPGLR